MGLMRISNPKEFTKENLKEEKQEPGAYIYLDKRGNQIYIGVSESVQHRLHAAYYGRSDYEQVRKKKKLRQMIRSYRTVYTDLDRARKLEHNKKEEMRFNDL